MTNFLDKLRPVALNAWRIVVGFTFFTHGGQKMFGWFGGNAVQSYASMIGLAGILEFLGGLLIILGVRTRYVAFLLSGEMATAYFYSHVRRGGLWPWDNGGELAAVYCLTFLAMAVVDGGDFSIDGLLKKRSAVRMP
ncbi:MAG: DoxX family protein [Gemmatimonadota bacterium]|nr:DoxX family protein [Gemmatimonadota bacterium]